jgi:glycerophosphoryl diester phosphodiesterase
LAQGLKFGNVALDMTYSNPKSNIHPALSSPQNSALTGAHRGASKYLRENTPAAFERAIELGADVIEFDVRATKDGVLVIHHNPDIEGVLIRDMPYNDAVVRFPDEQLTTLEATLNQIGRRAIPDIEIKVDGITAQVLEIVHAKYTDDQYVISSYLTSVLKEVKVLSPGTCTGLIIGSPLRSKSPLGHAKDLSPWSRIADTGANFLATHHFLADLALLRGAKRRAIPVMIWTVDSPKRRARFATTDGVVVVLTNHPVQL